MPSSALAGKLRKRFTPGEYLAMERAAVDKSEYYDGEIFAMSGARAVHNAIGANIIALLRPALLKAGCQTYTPDMKVAITRLGPFFYPDVTVGCGSEQFLDASQDVILNPILVVEVLSKSTQRYDREIKVGEYQRVRTIQAILLVSSERVSVEAHVRTSRAWKHQTATSLERSIDLASPACSLPLSTIYAGVEFATPPVKAPSRLAR